MNREIESPPESAYVSAIQCKRQKGSSLVDQRGPVVSLNEIVNRFIPEVIISTFRGGAGQTLTSPI